MSRCVIQFTLPLNYSSNWHYWRSPLLWSLVRNVSSNDILKRWHKFYTKSLLVSSDTFKTSVVIGHQSNRSVDLPFRSNGLCYHSTRGWPFFFSFVWHCRWGWGKYSNTIPSICRSTMSAPDNLEFCSTHFTEAVRHGTKVCHRWQIVRHNFHSVCVNINRKGWRLE